MAEMWGVSDRYDKGAGKSDYERGSIYKTDFISVCHQILHILKICNS